MSAAARQYAERILMLSIDENPRRLVKGSMRLTGLHIVDWTEQTKRGPVARTSYVNRDAVLEVLAEAVTDRG